MAGNGNLPDSSLSPIAGGGQLRNDAAAAWNAMAARIYDERGVRIRVNGPDSAYRTYARQVYWRNYWCSRGACQNAAVPGTSNHGWGIATDVPSYVQSLIGTFGSAYGWRKSCSDAPWEAWHYKWCGGWSGQNPGPDYEAGPTGPSYPTLKNGDKGKAVKRMQRHLHRWNVGLTRPNPDGTFGDNTKDAVRQFQIVHSLKSDGVVGKNTWKALRQRDHLYNDERAHLNRTRLYRAKGAKKYAARIKMHQEWMAKRAHSIYKVAQSAGWGGQHRRERHHALKRAAGKHY